MSIDQLKERAAASICAPTAERARLLEDFEFSRADSVH